MTVAPASAAKTTTSPKSVKTFKLRESAPGAETLYMIDADGTVRINWETVETLACLNPRTKTNVGDAQAGEGVTSNVILRRKLENLSPAIVACIIDQGTPHDDGGVLKFSYDEYCRPGEAIRNATQVVAGQGNRRSSYRFRET